jgi:hypothetical protein
MSSFIPSLVVRANNRIHIHGTMLTSVPESVWIAKLQYGLKITFIFILILFIDSVNRVYVRPLII